MALNTAYDSKINKHFNKSDLILAIEKGHHTAENTPTSMGDSIKLVTDDYEVTPLPYPLYDGERDLVYVDVRSSTSIGKDKTLKVRNQPELEFLEILSRLELKWSRAKHTSELQSTFSYSNDIFINWFTDLISHKLSLSPIHTMRLRALSAFYLIGLFDNNPKKSELERYAALLSRKFAVSIDICYEVLDMINSEVPTNIESFVEAMKMIELGTRVKDFSTRALFNYLNGSFFGVNNPTSFVGVAVEYPPAFAAICALTEKYSFMSKSSIGKIVQETNKRNRTTVSKGMKQLFMDIGVESATDIPKIFGTELFADNGGITPKE